MASAAVVDDEGRLVGRITHDDLLDVAEEEAAEDLYRMAGTDAAELETSSILRAARVRLTWLLPCMGVPLLTAAVLQVSGKAFDPVLFGALVSFAPMLGAISGNTGAQISTVIVRGFATGDFGSSRFSHALRREGRIALAIAPVCGLVAYGLAALGLDAIQALQGVSTPATEAGMIPLAVGTGMTVAVLVAATLGLTLPFVFRRLGIDPAIASGPLVSTSNDFFSMSLYMLIAYYIAAR